MKKILLILFLISSIVSLAAQAAELSTSKKESQKTNLIFDTDASNDDFIALIYLINHPKINLKAVTIVGTGEAHGPQGANNAADLCYLLDKPNMPIAYGNPQSLENSGRPFPDYIRQMIDNILVGKGIAHHPHSTIKNGAVELIKNIIVSSKQPVTILATGPLTNIAEFIKQYPALIPNVQKIIFMGGAVNVPGNIKALDSDSPNTVAEWNVYADPKAAQIVFTSGIPIVLVPLDATNQVPMTKEFFESVSHHKQADLKLIHDLLKMIIDELGMNVFLNDFYLWDSLAAMVCADDSIAQFTEIPIVLDVETAHTKPVTKDTPGMSLISVATKINNPQNILKQLVGEIADATPAKLKQDNAVNLLALNH